MEFPTLHTFACIVELVFEAFVVDNGKEARTRDTVMHNCILSAGMTTGFYLRLKLKR